LPPNWFSSTTRNDRGTFSQFCIGERSPDGRTAILKLSQRVLAHGISV
jgi:hypothetical protein